MRLINAILFAAGVVALIWMVARLGPESLAEAALAVGWVFALAVAAHLAGIALGALSLRLCVGAPEPFRFYFAANLAGHAVNEATPLSKAGEVVKLTMITERAGAEHTAGGLIVWNISLMITGALSIAAGCAIALAAFPVASAARAAVIGLGLGFAALAAVTLLFLYVRVGRWPLALLSRLGVGAERLARWERSWLEIESHWRRVSRDSRRVAAILALAVAIRGANLLEAVFILGALGIEPLWASALVGLASFQLSYWLTGFVPLQVGTAEGGTWAAFVALGLSGASGVALELVRKLRRLLFIAVGLIVLGVMGLRRPGNDQPS
jgi:hypothetical protein